MIQPPHKLKMLLFQVGKLVIGKLVVDQPEWHLTPDPEQVDFLESISLKKDKEKRYDVKNVSYFCFGMYDVRV